MEQAYNIWKWKQSGYLLTNKKAYEKMSQAKNPFGDGKASDRILKACLTKIVK